MVSTVSPRIRLDRSVLMTPDTKACADGVCADAPAGPSTHTMQRGDTLGELARAHGLSLDELMAANPEIRDPKKVQVGQVINVPQAAEAQPTRAPVNAEASREVASSRLGGVDARALQGAVPTTTSTAAPRTPDNVGDGQRAVDLPTTGASARTARQDRAPAGVEGSRQMARNDERRVARFRDTFQEVGAQHGIDPAILAGIASRESRGGSALDLNGSGDNGNGHGLMQVDRRYHRPQGGPFSEAHINQAAGILAGFRDELRGRFPNWSDGEVMKAAISAYNRGTNRITDPATSDSGTTGRDYANDVIARAQYFSEQGF